MRLAYIYRFDTENPGDLYSSPMHYLGNTRNGVVVDIFAEDIPEMSVDVVVIGGGALLTNKKFVRNLDAKLEKIKSKYTIVWGAGYDPSVENIINKDRFDLFSSREHKVDPTIQWVPCSSCLHDVFRENESVNPTNDFLVVDHFKRSIDFDKPHTRIINRPNSIRNIVEQIAKHRYVVTSSYHVAYWSILLGRRCAVVGESLPKKFNRMKHFPVKAKVWHDDLYDQAKIWHNARYESIKANYKFHRSIEDLVGVEKPLQLLSMKYNHLKRDIT